MPTTQTDAAKKSVSKRPLKRTFRKTGIAPLVQVDRMELGDKRLSPEEAVARETESLLRMCAKNKIGGQNELEDVDRSSGPRMAWTELIRRLQICNPGIRVKDGSWGSVALYFKKRSDEYTPDELLTPEQAFFLGIKRPKDDFFLHHKYVGGFEKQSLPEYSTVSIDSSHLAVREFRSWRSVLISLIKAKVITYRAAIDEFGDPSSDRRSNRWLEQLQNYR